MPTQAVMNASSQSPARTPSRFQVGTVPVDVVDMTGALEQIERLVGAGSGGLVFTPNVDHVVQAEHEPRLRDAYANCSLSLADGMPVVWAAKLLGRPLPERVAGSDLTWPLLERAAERGWRVYFLGGAPGSAEKAIETLASKLPALRVVGFSAPMIDMNQPDSFAPIAADIARAEPDLVVVALGAPKQEIFSNAIAEQVRPAVLLGLGAVLDFLAGTVPRAPRWMSRFGLEWLYRLAREPRRLWRRYLVRDPKFVFIVARQLRSRRARGFGAEAGVVR